MIIKSFYYLHYKSINDDFFNVCASTIGDIFVKFNLTPLDITQKTYVRISINAQGKIINIDKGDARVNLGGDFSRKGDVVSFNALLNYSTKHICLNTVERDCYTSRVISFNTFAENFRIRSDFYPLPKNLSKFNFKNFQGIGKGTATINRETQKIHDLKLYTNTV